MSYILDALRRAESERDRGQVPGLGAQPNLAPVAPTASAKSGLARGLAWAAAALGLALLLAWWWPRGVATAPPPVSSGGTASPSVSETGTGQPSTPGPATVPPVAARDRAEPGASPPALLPTPAPTPLPVVVSAPPPPPPPAPSSPPVLAAPPPTAARADGTRIVPLAELTPEQRRTWPALTIGGAVYSDHAPSRFVIVGGQILHEGGTAAPGLTVERIGPRSVILRWRDTLVEVPL